MNKIQEILNGWGNLIIKDEEVEKLARPRLEICAECPEMSNYPNEVQMFSFCKICKCNISSKTRSVNSKCPKELW